MRQGGDASIAPGAITPHLGLYIHVPFCSRKCGYCAFSSVPVSPGRLSQYSKAMVLEINRVAGDRRLRGRSFTTVYVGGGTPSILPRRFLRTLLDTIFEAFAFGEEPEVTIEANPESFDRELASLLAGLPMGRVSLGAQSFRADVLLTLGRSHDPDAVRRSVGLARQEGLSSVSLDLIYGTPGERQSDWEESLRAVGEIRPDHISCYCLSIEAGTPIARAVKAGRLCDPDEALQRDMYAAACSLFTAEGYEHYEISNFALPGSRSKHNMGYWRRGEYIGLGPSAHSFISGSRWCNYRDVDEYCGKLRAGASPVDWGETISPEQELEETVMLALRTSDGLDMEAVRSAWGSAKAEELIERARPLAEAGLLEVRPEVMRISHGSYFVSDDIIARLLPAAR